MKNMRNVFGVFVVVAVFAWAFSTVALVGVAWSGDFPLQSDCYPTNGYVISPGPTEAEGKASGKVASINIEDNPANTITDMGGATVSVQFAAKIKGANTGPSDGTMKGGLIAEIKWNDGSPKTVFRSGCVQEIYTDGAGPLGELEAEFEGAIENFPGYKGTTKAGVASIVVNTDPDNAGRYKVALVLELGYTCHEDNYTLGDIETDSIVLTNLKAKNFEISRVTAGRWSFPPGFNDTTNQCASSFTEAEQQN